MERIGDEVRRELGRFGVQGSMPAIVAAWPELVGETIARNAWPGHVGRDGTLHVNTSSSTWAFELSQLGPAVLERLQAALGKDAPRSLRFAPGPVPEPPVAVEAEQPVRVRPLSAESLSDGASLAGAIDNPGLRERVARAAAWSLEQARSDRSL